MAGRLSLQLPDGNSKFLVIKKQENHLSRTFLHPFRGIPTLEKELSNIIDFRQYGIPSLEPVYYEKRHNNHTIQAILVTEYLDGYTPLDIWVQKWHNGERPKPYERNALIQAIADLVKKIHQNRIQHNCLYPKHLLARWQDNKVQVRIIDLEKAKWRPFGNGRRIRDLESLDRRAMGWSRTDRMRFLMAYSEVQYFDIKAKDLCRQIMVRSKKKNQV